MRRLMGPCVTEWYEWLEWVVEVLCWYFEGMDWEGIAGLQMRVGMGLGGVVESQEGVVMVEIKFEGLGWW